MRRVWIQSCLAPVPVPTYNAPVDVRIILHPVSIRTSFMRLAAPLLMDTAALLQWK
jgi:hypothetical protein